MTCEELLQTEDSYVKALELLLRVCFLPPRPPNPRFSRRVVKVTKSLWILIIPCVTGEPRDSRTWDSATSERVFVERLRIMSHL